MADVEVTETVNADPGTLYGLVSDLPRMGEWSPENTGGKWLGGATGPTVGARFRGTNRAGVAVWATNVTVTAADPGRRFAFDVGFLGVPISTWEYDLAGAAGSCTVTERWTDRRPAFMRATSFLTGVVNRNKHNRDGMQKTLQRLKAAAESGKPAV
jgi:hypothetical protein